MFLTNKRRNKRRRKATNERGREQRQKSEKKNKDKKRGQGEEGSQFRQQYQERARSGRAYNESLKGDESSRYRVEIQWRKFEAHRSRYTGERMGFTLPDGSFTLLVIVVDSRQRQWKELLGV